MNQLKEIISSHRALSLGIELPIVSEKEDNISDCFFVKMVYWNHKVVKCCLLEKPFIRAVNPGQGRTQGSPLQHRRINVRH
jgi:hypothetical protein